MIRLTTRRITALAATAAIGLGTAAALPAAAAAAKPAKPTTHDSSRDRHKDLRHDRTSPDPGRDW
jgi:hypothetical protein